MTASELRWLTGLHGVLGWLAVAGLSGALVKTALEVARARGPGEGPERGRGGALRSVKGWIPALIALATVLMGAAVGSGVALDLPYRGLVRQRLFLASPHLGWMFERKLHLSFGALMLAGCAGALAGAAALARRRKVGDAGWVVALERGARVALIVSALWALAAATIAVVVARQVTW
ncbi:hypothetical protein [Chondromyces apiculatus]|uniref:Uncharacterized protein n=1 Tax=Chondromyces apiculatus DSM 436 TaxID=1192034 RepID=A0A017T8P8_9BACT|nr:hypothetical protein [Chondromyces apiculatus]EYF05623.1 Hypothetical protein CAP_3171 [Chondromyces apiculatus DSM 436]